jgi:hypothetical protein
MDTAADMPVAQELVQDTVADTLEHPTPSTAVVIAALP